MNVLAQSSLQLLDNTSPVGLKVSTFVLLSQPEEGPLSHAAMGTAQRVGAELDKSREDNTPSAVTEMMTVSGPV